LLSGIGAETLSVVSVERRSLVARVGAALLHVRWFVRAPIWLYRTRLGVVFGSRLLMIEHTGRTPGLRRYVVLEIVDRPSPGRYVVVAGFGRRAQWLRNVEANPQVRVYLGSRAPVAAVARRLDPDATTASRSWLRCRRASAVLGQVAAGSRGNARNPHRRAGHRATDDRSQSQFRALTDRAPEYCLT